MKNSILALFLLGLLGGGGLSAQVCSVGGVVTDEASGEALIGAYVKAGGQIVATDIDGRFLIEIPTGKALLEVSYIGYESAKQEVECLGTATGKDAKDLMVNFALQTLVMQEAIVVTDLAIDRKTPVAFTNVLPAKIQEELAGRDLPMVLNTTPGVYATQQGGGDGDARVTIRGFDQTNLAVMVDGVPMNDMENGSVYWSNWSGLDLVLKTFQVQRGLGASKLALPSVGGTMNILTGGDETGDGVLNYQSEVGSFGYFRNTVSGVFGSQEKGFVHVAGSWKTNQGFSNGLFSEAYAYYLKGTKNAGRHRLSFTAFGAPQRHGQRTYTAPIHYYDTTLAEELYQPEVYAQLQQEILDNPTTVAANFGYDFNPFVINYLDNDYVAGDFVAEHPERGPLYTLNDTIAGEPVSRNSRVNFYHKPIVTIRDFFRLNDNTNIVTTAYASFGNGGGMRLDGGASTTDSDLISGGGEIDYQRIYDGNVGVFSVGNQSYVGDPDNPSMATSWLASAYNNHRWFGALSTISSDLTEHVNLSGGVDVRRYTGIHYRAVDELVGGDFAAVSLDRRSHNDPYDSRIAPGDKYLYHDEGHVAWAGGFGQVEWDHHNWSAFTNVSFAQSWYKGIDFFRPKVIEIDGVTYEVNSESRGGVLGSFDYDSPSVLGEDGTGNEEVVVNGEQILASDPRLSTYETPWVQLSGYTVKGGGSYIFHEHFFAFANLGYLSKAPQFNSVIDINNNLIDGYENQYVKAIELGATFSTPKFMSRLNVYRTGWENRPVNRFRSLARLTTDPIYSSYNPDIDEEEAQNFGYNLLAVDALHKGIELDMSYEPNSKWDIEGLVSIGDWRWANDPVVEFYNRLDNSFVRFEDTGEIAFDTLQIDGLPVGNAAQTQVGGSLTFRPARGSYLRARYTSFSRQWSDYSPNDALGTEDVQSRDPWAMPAYGLLDFMAGTRVTVSDDCNVILRLAVTNVLNERYISDGRGNDDYGWFSQNTDITEMGAFNASRATVFIGLPRLILLSAVLELKNLQQKKPKE